MGGFLGRKSQRKFDCSDPCENSMQKQYTKDDIDDIQKHDLYKKGIDQMANEKLEDAVRSFDLAIRIDPNYVDAWIKKGYAHFHLDEYTVALSSYDKAIEIDLTNAEAWNLQGFSYYKI